MHDNELPPDARDALRDLPREVQPPSELEDRVVQSLIERGLVAPSTPSHASRWLRPAAGLAAALVLFVSGVTVGRMTDPNAVNEIAGRHFLLLLYDARGSQLTTMDEVLVVEEYRQWAGGLAEQGRLIAAEKLHDAGRFIRPTATDVVVDETPPADGTDVVSGYFVIAARDYAEAVRIAIDSPHVRYGGHIGVREIDPT